MRSGTLVRSLMVGALALGCGVSTVDQGPPTPKGDESSPPTTTTTSPSTPAPSASTPVDPTPSTPPPSGPASLHDNRDRLIDTLGVRRQLARCSLWAGLTPTERGVFLTITDLLGKRSFLTNDPATGPRSGPDLEMALDHVTMVYEIRDSHGSNGGGDNNRIFLQFDTALITAMRSFNAGLPEWDKSSDIGGPHDPFDATSETIDGQPRGQSQFWSSDAKSKPLNRPGVVGIDDPHIVEIDIDYNWLHDSNPEADYFPDGKGRDHYAEVWTPKGVGTTPEFDYVPTGCTQ